MNYIYNKKTASFVISPLIKEKAPIILAEINKASSILLHCHPKPDPDSVGSALAMRFVLEKMGKKVTVIKGDSDIPEAFMYFPGAADIVGQNYFEVDLSKFDLFIIQDTASLNMISNKSNIVFPENLKTIVIDHHKSNNIKADINLVEVNYPANAQILADLFTEWKVQFDRNIAENLFIGLYTDTMFKYPNVNSHTFEIASFLAEFIPRIDTLINPIDNSNTPASIYLKGLGLSHVEIFCGGHFAISSIPYNEIVAHNIKESDINPSSISSELRTVTGWDFCVCLIEVSPDNIRASFRSQDGDKYDVSLLAATINGGGHKAASGANIKMGLKEVKELLIKRAGELYNA